MTDDRLGLPSASAMPRVEACPASFSLARGITPVRTRQMVEWGESGDRIHLWLQWPGFIDLEPDEMDVAERCDQQRVSLLAKVFDKPVDAVYSEQRLWLTVGKTKVASGQMDYGAVLGNKGLIVDYKTSYGDTPDSAGNMQIRTNLVVLDEFLSKRGIVLEEAYGAIIQPLVSHEPQLVRYTRAELDAARTQIIDIVEKATVPGAPFKTGPYCRTCPALLVCQAAKREEDKLLEDDRLVGVDELDVRLAGLTPAEMGPLLEAWKVAKVRGENLEAAAKLALKQDIDSVPGWTLGKAVPMRTVTDVGAFFHALKSDGLIDEPTFIRDCVKVTLGGTEAAIKDRNKMRSKKEAKATVDATCADYIQTTYKEQSLKRSDASDHESESPFS
jgi:hypothetical protein